MDKEKRTKIIYKRDIANGLLDEGHQIIRLLPDKDDSVKTVFVFEDSLELRDNMQKVIKMIRKQRLERENEANEEEDSIE